MSREIHQPRSKVSLARLIAISKALQKKVGRTRDTRPQRTTDEYDEVNDNKYSHFDDDLRPAAE